MAVVIDKPVADFEAQATSGQTFSLAALKGKQVVIYFYPKDSTPGCTTQACGFRDSYPTVEKRKGVVLGVSPDGVASHQKFKTNQKLPFPLVVDGDHKIAEAYGVWGEKSMYGRKYMGIIRSHFVIDEKGKIVDAQVKVSPKDSVERALEALAV